MCVTNTGKLRPEFSLIFIFVLGITMFFLCFASEFQKAKGQPQRGIWYIFQGKDLYWDGKSCYLPESHAFRSGTAALVCVLVAQTIENAMICRSFLKTNRNETTPFLYYLVKDGMFASSGILGVSGLGAVLGAFSSNAKSSLQVDPQNKIRTHNVL
ncbi:hypothetical protein N665_0072s0017 [Sinapis alba]|nr:hypothetical protein N665_0072s0017 [Sinapis alba]